MDNQSDIIIDLSGECLPQRQRQQQRYFGRSAADTKKIQPNGASAIVVGRTPPRPSAYIQCIDPGGRNSLAKKRRRCLASSTVYPSGLTVKYSDRNFDKTVAATSGKVSTTGQPCKRGRSGVEYVNPRQRKMAEMSTPTWIKEVDPASGRPYYYHCITREVSWDKPNAAANAVAMNAGVDVIHPTSLSSERACLRSSVAAQHDTDHVGLRGSVAAQHDTVHVGHHSSVAARHDTDPCIAQYMQHNASYTCTV